MAVLDWRRTGTMPDYPGEVFQLGETAALVGIRLGLSPLSPSSPNVAAACVNCRVVAVQNGAWDRTNTPPTPKQAQSSAAWRVRWRIWMQHFPHEPNCLVPLALASRQLRDADWSDGERPPEPERPKRLHPRYRPR